MKKNLIKRIIESILEGDSGSVQKTIKEALNNGVLAGEILNNSLIPGMVEVGVLFKDGEMFVPEVLVSAKAMQSGIDIIKPMLAPGDVKKIGKILTVTVSGDLHDIGVKLVGLMLEGAGFEVIYMGVDKSAEEIVNKVKQLQPDILGMSAMLTTTMHNMKEVVDLLKEHGVYDTLKVMVGGAPVSNNFAQAIGARYSPDATEAVKTAKELLGIN